GGPSATNAPPLEVVLVVAAGMLLGSLPHIAAGRRAGLTGMSARLIAVTCVAFAFHPLSGYLLGHPKLAFAMMAALAVLGWLIETVISALIRADDLRARYLVTLADEVRVQWRLGPGGRRLGDHHGVRRGGHGHRGARDLRRPAAGDPVRVPQVRGHPGNVPADRQGPCSGHRGRRVRRERALAQGQPPGARDRPRAWH